MAHHHIGLLETEAGGIGSRDPVDLDRCVRRERRGLPGRRQHAHRSCAQEADRHGAVGDGQTVVGVEVTFPAHLQEGGRRSGHRAHARSGRCEGELSRRQCVDALGGDRSDLLPLPLALDIHPSLRAQPFAQRRICSQASHDLAQMTDRRLGPTLTDVEDDVGTVSISTNPSMSTSTLFSSCMKSRFATPAGGRRWGGRHAMASIIGLDPALTPGGADVDVGCRIQARGDQSGSGADPPPRSAPHQPRPLPSDSRWSSIRGLDRLTSPPLA